jgi:adenosylcobinamide kinase / adenosylcobinamide-phosphate guanylyltransferase
VSVTLVFGGASSGKSKLAESFCGKPRIYVATAEAFDTEMSLRIHNHQHQRGEEWTTLEAPLDLVGLLRSCEGKGAIVLVDCLTLWLTNLVMKEKDAKAEIDALANFAAQTSLSLVIVSNELGMGLVPEQGLSRRFRDLHGAMNQRVAEVAQNVVFVAAGLPLVLKGRLPE